MHRRTPEIGGSNEGQATRNLSRGLASGIDTLEFLAKFDMAPQCASCGRSGLDDEYYTDCVLLGPTDDETPTLICRQCVESGEADLGAIRPSAARLHLTR